MMAVQQHEVMEGSLGPPDIQSLRAPVPAGFGGFEPTHARNQSGHCLQVIVFFSHNFDKRT